MPTPATSEFSPPKSWDEFEDIIWEIFRRLWRDPEAKRYGRSGQAQQGVDIYGRDLARDSALVGVQCKRYAEGQFTRQVLEGEIAKAEAFKPPLIRYIIATTDGRDARLQEAVRLINQARAAAGKFTVDIWFWEDVCSALAEEKYRDLLVKYYGEWLRFIEEPGFTQFSGPLYPRLDYWGQIADLIKFYTEKFVGREEELQRVCAFAAQEEPGYLLIEAPPGYGKSAFLAKLINDHANGEWPGGISPALLYFFIRQEGERNTARYFLQALNSQLMDLLGQPGGVPTELGSLGPQFSQLWRQAQAAASPQRPLLLLVDGLDEIALESASLASNLPGDLKPYVHVVVASRPNPRPLEQVPLEHPFKQAGVLGLHKFPQAEGQALLTDTTAELAPRILELTGGEPLFARFVCQDVTEHGDTILEALEKNPPDGVDDYFDLQLKQLRELVRGKEVRDILGLLTVALGAMTLEEIAGALGLSLWDALDLTKPVMRFLLGEERLELMHLQLRKA